MKIKNKFFCGGGGEKRQLSPVKSEEFKKISSANVSKRMKQLTHMLIEPSNSKQDVKTFNEIIQEEILKKLNAISNIQGNNYILRYNPNIITFEFKTGNH